MYKEFTGARAFFVRLEADVDFYRPDPEAVQEDFLLCVGRDVGRDWKTLFEVLERVGIPSRVVTSAHRVEGLSIPPNVQLVTDRVPYPTLLEWYQHARLVVVNLPEIHRFTGQRALLEAMAMGKATIVGRTQAVVGAYELRDGKDVLLYEPGNAQDLTLKIQSLWENELQRRDLGAEARRFVSQIPRGSFSKSLRQIILESVAR
jgi:glycosyltransferase involved in cell wall biosynthesis